MKAKGGRGKVNEEKTGSSLSPPMLGLASQPSSGQSLRSRVGTPKPKRRTSAEVTRDANAAIIVETEWNKMSEVMREGYLAHIVKESDPVALALSLVEMMDAQQLRRFCVMLDEYKMQRDRKRPSTLPQDRRSEVAVDDCTLENCGVE